MNANELADAIEKGLDGFRRDLIVNMLRKQQEEIEYWKSAFAKAMALTEHMKHLEAQVYGGTTK